MAFSRRVGNRTFQGRRILPFQTGFRGLINTTGNLDYEDPTIEMINHHSQNSGNYRSHKQGPTGLPGEITRDLVRPCSRGQLSSVVKPTCLLRGSSIATGIVNTAIGPSKGTINLLPRGDQDPHSWPVGQAATQTGIPSLQFNLLPRMDKGADKLDKATQ